MTSRRFQRFQVALFLPVGAEPATLEHFFLQAEERSWLPGRGAEGGGWEQEAQVRARGGGRPPLRASRHGVARTNALRLRSNRLAN
jgi:hypothetical protein